MFRDEAEKIRQAIVRQGRAENLHSKVLNSCRGGNSDQRDIHGTNNENECSSFVPKVTTLERVEQFARREGTEKAAHGEKILEESRGEQLQNTSAQRAANNVASSKESSEHRKGQKEHLNNATDSEPVNGQDAFISLQFSDVGEVVVLCPYRRAMPCKLRGNSQQGQRGPTYI